VAEFIAIPRWAWDFFLECHHQSLLGRGCCSVGCAYDATGTWTWERTILALPCSILCLVPVALMTHSGLGRCGPRHGHLETAAGGLTAGDRLLLLATLGNGHPVDAVFQQSAITDKGLTTRDIPHGRVDTAGSGVCDRRRGGDAAGDGSAVHAPHVGGELRSGNSPRLCSRLSDIGVRRLFALGMFEAGMVAAHYNLDLIGVTPSEKWRGAA